MTKPTEAEIATALEGSISAWEERKAGKVRPPGRSSCPLCTLFNNRTNNNQCHGCPVETQTNKRFCKKTPYIEYDALWCAQVYENRDNHAELVEAASNEVDFLKSLRKPEPAQ